MACAAFTLALLPLAGATVTPEALRPAGRARTVVAVPTPVTYSMASRSGARAAVVGEEPAARSAFGVEMSSSKGTRLWTASALSSHDLPLAAEHAYRRAARQIAETDPGCGLPWTLLAGIGRVESDHGRYDGARLGTNGVSRPQIIGVRLDGRGPVAAIRDTDNGRWDHDRVWDRAVGPMQFIPSTWRTVARDGDGDGRSSPNDLHDATLAAAAYLCSGYGSVLGEAAMSAAVYRYNQDDYYVALVLAFERGYRTGVFVMPPPPTVEGETEDGATKGHRRHRTGGGSAGGPGGSGGAGAADGAKVGTSTKPAGSSSSDQKPAPTPSPSPSPKPSPKPTPQPGPEPAPETEPTAVTAVFDTCAGGHCLGGTLLDLGQASDPVAEAGGDYNKDGVVGTNGEELEPLLGTEVTMVVLKETGVAEVYSINGVPLA